MKTNNQLFSSITGFYLALIMVFIINGCRHSTSDISSVKKQVGEFTARMQLTKERLTSDYYKPEFTPEFILADVNIKPENSRRFYNYSGDLSGRYIEVMSSYNHSGDCGHVDEIVRQALAFQHSDGRFGDSTLVFSEEYIDKQHMPLLWGNGRLLVGILEYYKHHPDNKVLAAATRLGDFFVNSYQEVTPNVSKRLEGLGSDGIICFTQWVEPLVMLSIASGNPKYAEVAAKVYSMLPSRGTLHSHGYLTSLRGVLELYDYDHNKTHLDYVVSAYNDLVNSDDFTIYGSVKEYFGGSGRRDEGCSNADFIRLSFHLYSLTGDISYLEKGEFAIYNSLYYNQFFTGDFGHHILNNHESSTDIYNAAWWCCTMAGLRAMQIIQDTYLAENSGGKTKINLYIDTEYADSVFAFSIRRGKMLGDLHTYQISFEKTEGLTQPLLLRKPAWANRLEIYLNDSKIDPSIKDGYFVVNNTLKKGDVIEVRMDYLRKIITTDKRFIALDALKEPTDGALCYGPYILGIDNQLDFTFLAEPNDNVVYAHTIKNASQTKALAGILSNSYVGDVYLTANYKHSGFPSYMQTVFRPISELTFNRHPFSMVTMKFVPESDVNENFANKSIVEPWREQ